MKKKILTALALAAILAVSLIAAACGSDVTFKVVTEFNPEQGSVIITDANANEKDEFAAGAKVVVRVAAAEDYEIDTFTVNGADVEINDGIYGFYISANTVVKATFKSAGKKDDDKDNENKGDGDDKKDENEKTPEQLFAEALKAAQTTFTAMGSYVQAIKGGKNVTGNITTVFGEKAVNIIETDESGEIVYDDVYVDVDGKIAMPYHDINNEIKYYYASNDESFAEYGNPFKLLTVADFTAGGEANEYYLSSEKSKAAATAITGYTEEIDFFKVTVSKGKLATVDIGTKPSKLRTGEDDDGNPVYSEYVSTYVFAVTELGTAAVDSDKIAPYATAPEHTALKNALKTAGEAKSYTVGVYEQEYGYDDIEYNVYVTETAIYYDCEDWEEGYVQMGEGAATVVYPFDYDPETELVTLRDAVKGFPTVYSMRSSFNGFAPEIFVLNDNGDYVLRDECNTAEIVRDVLINFGDGLDQIRLYAGYALSVKFVLKSDALYRVELYYYVGDAFVKRTLTYSAWDSTTMPISFDNSEKLSVLDDYVGTYTDGKITAVIDKNSIVINDKAFEITDYDIQYDMFTGNWDGEEWFITKQGEKQLLLLYFGEESDDDVTYTLTCTQIDPVDIPDAYTGVWTANGVTVAIGYGMVEYNDTMHTVLSYDEDNDCLYTTDGQTTYRMFADKKNGNPVLLVIAYVDGLPAAYYDMTKVEGAVIVPKALMGTFEKFDGYYLTNFKATLGLTSVALEFGNDKPEVTLISAEYVSSYRYWKLTVEADGEQYIIAENSYSKDRIDIYSEETSFSVTLDRVTAEEPPTPGDGAKEYFYGTFEGDKNEVAYVLTISADQITLKIGDDAAIVITDFEYDEGEYSADFSFVIDDVEWGIFSYDFEDGVDSVILWNYSGLYAALARSDS